MVERTIISINISIFIWWKDLSFRSVYIINFFLGRSQMNPYNDFCGWPSLCTPALVLGKLGRCEVCSPSSLGRPYETRGSALIVKIDP